MKLIITIDTEEDNWGDFRPLGSALRNIERIPALQTFFDTYGIIPTYLVTYPVAADERSRLILREILDSGRCEIGAHCHPWNTPPFEETPGERNSMLCNLPPDLQRRKLHRLDEAIREHFRSRPQSFRTGRWGYGPEVAREIHGLGYTVDTSISPFIDWTAHHGPDFSDFSPRPFRFSPGDAFRPNPAGPMLEVPATIGFAQRDFARANALYRWAKRRPASLFLSAPILRRLRIANRIWLSPEVSTAEEMIQLARAMIRNGEPVLNMVIHSPALEVGLTPFVRTAKAQRDFMNRIEAFLRFARSSDFQSIRLCETPR